MWWGGCGIWNLKTWVWVCALVSISRMALGKKHRLSGLFLHVRNKHSDFYFIRSRERMFWKLLCRCIVICGWTETRTQVFWVPDRGLYLGATFRSHCHWHLWRLYTVIMSSNPCKTWNRVIIKQVPVIPEPPSIFSGVHSFYSWVLKVWICPDQFCYHHVLSGQVSTSVLTVGRRESA